MGCQRVVRTDPERRVLTVQDDRGTVPDDPGCCRAGSELDRRSCIDPEREVVRLRADDAVEATPMAVRDDPGLDPDADPAQTGGQVDPAGVEFGDRG